MSELSGRDWVPYKHLQAAQAEIERLQKENGALTDHCNIFHEDVERLQAEIERLRIPCDPKEPIDYRTIGRLRAEIERLRAELATCRELREHDSKEIAALRMRVAP